MLRNSSAQTWLSPARTPLNVQRTTLIPLSADSSLAHTLPVAHKNMRPAVTNAASACGACTRPDRTSRI